jgi:hypothetical protein
MKGGGGPSMMRRNMGLMRSNRLLRRKPLSALVYHFRAGGQFSQAQFAAAQRNLHKTTDYNKAVSKREDEYHCYDRVAEVSNLLHQAKFPGPLHDLVLAYDDGTLKFEEEQATLGSEERQANFLSLAIYYIYIFLAFTSCAGSVFCLKVYCTLSFLLF